MAITFAIVVSLLFIGRGASGAAVLGVAAAAQVDKSVETVEIAAQPVEVEEIDARPQYQYGYDVQDNLTGDSKSQSEVRDGDVVRGEYSLIDPDGFRRIVQYTADPVNGFNAVVRREPLVAAAPARFVKAAPRAVPAVPVVKPARLTYAAPAAPIAYPNSAFTFF